MTTAIAIRPINKQEIFSFSSNDKKNEEVLTFEVRLLERSKVINVGSEEHPIDKRKKVIQFEVKLGNMGLLPKKKLSDFVIKNEMTRQSFIKSQRYFGFIVLRGKNPFCQQIPSNKSAIKNDVFCFLSSESFITLPENYVSSKILDIKKLAVEFIKDDQGSINKILIAKKWTEQLPETTISTLGLCEFLKESETHIRYNQLTHYKIINLAQAKLVPLRDDQYEELKEAIQDSLKKNKEAELYTSHDYQNEKLIAEVTEDTVTENVNHEMKREESEDRNSQSKSKKSCCLIQ